MNQINVVKPYRYMNTWVFDDPTKKLVKEPFVAGLPELTDKTLTVLGLSVRESFYFFFSKDPFPQYDLKLKNLNDTEIGRTYLAIEAPDKTIVGMKAWFCPALLKYIDPYPEYLYIKMKRINKIQKVTVPASLAISITSPPDKAFARRDQARIFADPAYGRRPVGQGIKEAIEEQLSNNPEFIAKIEKLLSTPIDQLKPSGEEE